MKVTGEGTVEARRRATVNKYHDKWMLTNEKLMSLS